MDRGQADLTVIGIEELYLLHDILPVVDRITIRDIAELIILPQLPAHVKVLILENVNLNHRTRFSEGLKSLHLTPSRRELSMIEWIFPSTLERVIVHAQDSLVDLRSVTAPRLTVFQEGTKLNVLYPEALDKLTIQADEFDGKGLPPYLRALTLMVGEIKRGSVHESVKVLAVIGHAVGGYFGAMFPTLEELTIEDGISLTLEIDSPSLRTLNLNGISIDEPIVIDAPDLETLTVLSASPEDNIDLSLNTELGKSLVTLFLESAMAFPVDTDWGRLTSLTLIESDVELPFIQWLEHLETDMPVLTNGIPVETLDEYKAAWGVTRKKKAAQRS